MTEGTVKDRNTEVLTEPPGEITQKMINVMQAVGAIRKGQRHQQGYTFRGIDDFYNQMHSIMAAEGIITLPKLRDVKETEITNSKGNTGTRVVVTVRYVFKAADMSEIDTIAVGEASDYGDKATLKAMSAAHKLALTQIFMIPTLEDGEGAGHEPPQTRRKPTNQQKPGMTELDKAKVKLFKKVSGIRKQYSKDMDDTTWIQKVIEAELKKKAVESLEELAQVEKAIMEDPPVYDLTDGEVMPF